MKKFAIVGFGAAGYKAAQEARRLDPEAQIDVYSDTNTAPYNPMLTTYYVKGAIPYEALFPFGSLEKITKELNINFYADTPVTGVIPEEKTLRFADGSSKQYDKILFSTGASAVMPPCRASTCRACAPRRTRWRCASGWKRERSKVLS